MRYKITDLKKFPRTNGVYKIFFENSTSGKVYIGSASGKNNSGFYKRWIKHLSDLSNNKSGCRILQNAFNKYGKDNIIFEVLEECLPLNCLIREQFYIDKYNSYENGYNARPLASNNGGLKQSEHQKIVIYNKYKLIRDSYKEKINNLYKEGKTTREISKYLNISRNYISKIFKENNIIPRKESGLKKRKVYQYDMMGNFILEYESINDCALKTNGNIQGINLVLNGKCKHYKFMYYNFNLLPKDKVIDNINILKIKSKNKKYLNIKQVDKLGNIVKIWRDTREIIEAGICKHNGLNKSLRNKTLYNGYYWQ